MAQFYRHDYNHSSATQTFSVIAVLFSRSSEMSHFDQSDGKTESQVISQQQIELTRFTGGELLKTSDVVAVEEPLEIRVAFGQPEARRSRSLSITMRTLGHDLELAIGFLLSEGLIDAAHQVTSHEFCGPPPDGSARGNTLLIDLSSDVQFDTAQLQRHFYTTSSCGVCGKASLDAIRAQGMKAFSTSSFEQSCLSASLVTELPNRLREKQDVFDQTGGLHAAGLFDIAGELIEVHEDVGRHNAVDKLLGSQLIAGNIPLHDRILSVSGRASFELVQKALLGGIPIMVAVGAPSSLAVELAREFNMTLIGFTTRNRFNIYSCPQRVNPV
jgi:FdhD protein